MTEYPPDPDEEAVAPQDAEVAHDFGGTDLASDLAARVRGILPAPRGVRRAPKQSKFRPRRRPGDPEERSGSGPDARDPQPLGAALNRLIDERGWNRQVSVRSLLLRWTTLVGPTNAEHSHPESYSDGELVIRAESTVWATSLRMIAPQLVAELNHQLGDGTVTRVTVLGPVGPTWKAGIRSVRDGRGPRDTYG